MLENIISIVAVAVIGFLLYAQRNLRKCAKEDAADADSMGNQTRKRALELAIAGGYDPEHPERGGGIRELAMADGATRAMVASGRRPAEIFGLAQASARVDDLRRQARADRNLANWLIVWAVAIGALRLILLLIG